MPAPPRARSPQRSVDAGRIAFVALVLSCGLAAGFGRAATGAEPDAAGKEFFEAKIRPVLVQHCYECHSAAAAEKKKLKAGLRLDTPAGMRSGGESGPAVVPGDVKKSLLVAALKHESFEMPPTGRLPAPVVADFVKWVELGAPDPRGDDPAPANATAAPIDWDAAKQFWSFRPPVLPNVPDVQDAAWCRTDLDRFVRAAQESRGLVPVRTATRRELVRRAAFDLTGLPPTPDEVDAFLGDASDDDTAWAALVDRLLASPHYGERWARHWLDVARYAEDQAHTFGVKPKTSAYQYRDWVVRAFNDDMPYDAFVRRQLAGDLLEESPGDAADPFLKFAGLGFLGLGAEYYKNTAKEQALAEEMDDRIDTVTRGFLGLTVSCARCHDHKFDPVPTRDYYSLAGLFYGSSMTDAPLATPEEIRRYEQGQQRVKDAEQRLKDAQAGIGRRIVRESGGDLAQHLVTAWRVRTALLAGGAANTGEVAKTAGLKRHFLDRILKAIDPAKAKSLPAPLVGWHDVKAVEKDQKDWAKVTVPPALQEIADRFQVAVVAALDESERLEREYRAAREAAPPEKQASIKRGDLKKPDRDLVEAALFAKDAPFLVAGDVVEQLSIAAEEKKELAACRAEIEQVKKDAPKIYPVAHVLKGGGQTMQVYQRGNPTRKGEWVPRGFLQVLSAPRGDMDETTAKAATYDRAALARDVAAPENPLTARVFVNRIWQWHFGRGLVGTASNFGKLGDRPTHPELLDWLTVRFVSHGWSVKRLHREILLSSTYRLSSDPHAGNQERDADDLFLWRAPRRRLDVEQWRDAVLAVAGTLDRTAGGPTFDLKNATAARRTLYAKISRHELDGFLRLFDFPDANVTSEKRTATTVPQQQLFVLNSEFVVGQAKALAARVAGAAAEDPERVRLAYRLAYARDPLPEESALALAFLSAPATANAAPEGKTATPEKAAPPEKLDRWQRLAQTLLAANEFLYVD